MLRVSSKSCLTAPSTKEVLMSEPRPELFYNVSNSAFDVVQKPLTVWERLYEIGALRKARSACGSWPDLGDLRQTARQFDSFTYSDPRRRRHCFPPSRSGELPKAAFFTITLFSKGTLPVCFSQDCSLRLPALREWVRTFWKRSLRCSTLFRRLRCCRWP